MAKKSRIVKRATKTSKLKTTSEIINEALFKIGSPLKIRLPPKEFFVTSNDPVNHPGHYGGKDNIYETIKVLEARLTRDEFIGAMKFNVYKYNDRAKLKGNELENYEKAQFYQNYLVDYMKKK